MRHAIQHKLDVAASREVVERAFASYEVRYAAYEPTLRWTSDHSADLSLRVKGVSLSGALELEDQKMSVEVDVPLLLRPFQQRALHVIEREVRKWLATAPPT